MIAYELLDEVMAARVPRTGTVDGRAGVAGGRAGAGAPPWGMCLPRAWPLGVWLQVMDFGYPQFTEAKILSEYIKTDAYKMAVSCHRRRGHPTAAAARAHAPRLPAARCQPHPAPAPRAGPSPASDGGHQRRLVAYGGPALQEE